MQVFQLPRSKISCLDPKLVASIQKLVASDELFDIGLIPGKEGIEITAGNASLFTFELMHAYS